MLASTNFGFVVFLLFLYFLPSLIAQHRLVPNRASVFIVDLFLGWTFIGWVIALAMAARSIPEQD